MPKFSTSSIDKLHTCHKDLQILFRHVIKGFDCTVVYGHRSKDVQFDLYKKGREYVNGVWVIENKKEVVTYIDGVNKMSAHNHYPSLAADVAPYPSLYSHADTALYFAGYVMGIADVLKRDQVIEHDIICGRDWDDDNDLQDQTFYDTLHFEIKH